MVVFVNISTEKLDHLLLLSMTNDQSSILFVINEIYNWLDLPIHNYVLKFLNKGDRARLKLDYQWSKLVLNFQALIELDWSSKLNDRDLLKLD